MGFDDHKNFAYSTVSTAPSPAASGTSLIVASGQGALFPTVPFNATIWPTSAQPLSTNAEIVRVTAISTDTLTIVRAQEGTSARTVVVGDQIAATITDKTLTDLERDPASMSFAEDDFFGGHTETGEIGVLGWSNSLGTIAIQDGIASHPGIYRQSTGASSGTVARLYLFSSSGVGLVLPADTFEMVFIFRLNHADGDTQLRIGLGPGDWGANPPVNGIYLEKLIGDTNWFFVTRASSAETRTDTGVTVDTGWERFKFRRKDASTIAFSLNGAAEVDHTTNIPTAQITPGAQIRNNAAADKSFDLDYFSALFTGLSR